MSSVLPIHDHCIEPTKDVSNFIIPGWEDTEHTLNRVAAIIRSNIMPEENQKIDHMYSQYGSGSESFPAEQSVPNHESAAD
jgi:hypothetical protein